MKRFLILLCVLTLLISAASAQSFDVPEESGRAFALSIDASGGLQIGEKSDFPSSFGTIDIDFNPREPSRWARIDNFGILRFVPEGSTTEGVYTFKPFFEGFEAASPEENKYFVRRVEWSPDGTKLLFYSRNDALPDLDQGVWFWQPETVLQNAFPLLRPCPPYCDNAGLPASYAGWEVLGMEWASDSYHILLSVFLNGENRRALFLRTAQPDPQIQQAITAPTPILYDYAHWGANAERIVVSGRNPEGVVVFGTIARDGTSALTRSAQEINQAWVQDAVQAADGQIYMLGSSVGEGAALQIVNQEGLPLTLPIGDAAPDTVKWRRDAQGVILHIGERTYAALINGTVYDITETTESSPLVEWIEQDLPAQYERVAVPEALPMVTPEVTPEPALEIEPTVPGAVYSVGDLLRVSSGTLNIYDEPAADAALVGTLAAGDELIIADGPLSAGGITWYRVQTLNFTGWIQDTSTLERPQN